jgi:hypothetical protein
MASIKLPPGCGKLLEEPLLYNEFQQRFMRARRMRFCLSCKTMGHMNEMGQFTCANCQKEHNGRWGNLTAPRAFNRFLLLAGRGGGKTLVGAHAVREELMIPGAVWWALGASYKLLHDSTFPTLVGLLHPQWIERWDPEHMEITLKNGAMVAFRSLEDPDRARGPHGIGGMWFDEAAKCPERAWHVGTPMLIKSGGVALATTTVLGYDWTYEQIETKALIHREPGYWAAKWTTLQNPLFRTNPVMRAEIERARKTMTPEFFAEEYETHRGNTQGLIYGDALIDANTLKDDEAVKRYIPEWPEISPSRKVLIGIDEGGDHPFGATLGVVTEFGIVIVKEYLERMRANSQAHDEVHVQMGLHRFYERVYAANKNALALRLEWAQKGTGVIKAESDFKAGVQRVQAWLLCRKLKFAYTVPKTIAQMKAHRWGDNTVAATGEKKANEKPFKLKDELPDAIRYKLMAWPELPEPDQLGPSDAEVARLAAFDEKTRYDLQMMKEFAEARSKKGIELQPHEDGYPAGNLYQHDVTDGFFGGGW